MRAMGKHLTAAERDYIRELVAKKKLPLEIHAKLLAMRRRRRQPPLDITTVRRHLRGKTFKAGAVEARGRKRIYSKRAVQKMNKVRKQLIRSVDSEQEVHWGEIVKKARVAKAHPTTTARAFLREGIAVARRAPRQKPLRGAHTHTHTSLQQARAHRERHTHTHTCLHACTAVTRGLSGIYRNTYKLYKPL